MSPGHGDMAQQELEPAVKKLRLGGDAPVVWEAVPQIVDVDGNTKGKKAKTEPRKVQRKKATPDPASAAYMKAFQDKWRVSPRSAAAEEEKPPAKVSAFHAWIPKAAEHKRLDSGEDWPPLEPVKQEAVVEHLKQEQRLPAEDHDQVPTMPGQERQEYIDTGSHDDDSKTGAAPDFAKSAQELYSLNLELR